MRKNTRHFYGSLNVKKSSIRTFLFELSALDVITFMFAQLT